MYDPSTVSEDRIVQDFYEVTCSLLIWIDFYHTSNVPSCSHDVCENRQVDQNFSVSQQQTK